MNFPRTICFFLCSLFFTSCTQNLDFSQIDDYSSSSVFTYSLAHFKVTPNDFTDPTTGNEIDLQPDVTDYRVFEHDYVRKNLVKTIFYIEIKNEFDRDVTVDVNLLDDGNNIIYRFNQLAINANDLNFINPPEEILVSSNPSIINVTRISVKVNLSPSAIALNPSDPSEFEFKSSTSIHLDTD